MGNDAAPPTYRYDAFISYRHVEPDRKWAKWLHGALETYRVPRDLVAKGLPARLTRVFRDEEELPANADLSAQITAALDESKFLIVVCSPRAPLSKWVNAEVEHFRKLGRHDKILALLIEGEPRDAFPPALTAIRRLATDAAAGTSREVIEEVEPLAADVRPDRADVKTHTLRSHAQLRLLACILGCRFDDLRHRDAERRARRTRVFAGALMLLVAVLAGLTWLAWTARAESRRQAYCAYIAAAGAAVEQSTWQEARYYLNLCPPDLQGWEWRYLMASCDDSLTTLSFEDDRGRQTSLDPSGSGRLLRTTGDGVEMWNVADGARLWQLREGATNRRACWSKSGSMVTLQRLTGETMVLNALTGATLWSSKDHAEEDLLWNSPCFVTLDIGEVLLYETGDHQMATLNVATGEQTMLPVHAKDIYTIGGNTIVCRASESPENTTVGFELIGVSRPHARVIPSIPLSTGEPQAELSPDGKRLFIYYDSAAPGWKNQLIDTSNGAVLATVPWLESPSPGGGRVAADFSNDGQLLVVKLSNPNSIVILNAATGAVVRSISTDVDYLQYLTAQSPDSRTFVLADKDGATFLLSDSSSTPIPLTRASNDRVCSFFSVCGTLVGVQAGAIVHVFSAHDGSLVRTLRAQDMYTRAMFALPDGKLSMVGSAGSDQSRGTIAQTWRLTADPVPAGAIRWPERIGGRFKIGPGPLIWEGDQIDAAVPFPELAGGIHTVDPSKDGTRLLVSSDMQAAICTWPQGRLVTRLDAPTGPLVSAAFSPDGNRVVTAGADGSIRIWDTQTGVHLLKLRVNGVPTRAGFTFDGNTLVAEDKSGVCGTWDSMPAAERERRRIPPDPAAKTSGSSWVKGCPSDLSPPRPETKPLVPSRLHRAPLNAATSADVTSASSSRSILFGHLPAPPAPGARPLPVAQRRLSLRRPQPATGSQPLMFLFPPLLPAALYASAQNQPPSRHPLGPQRARSSLCHSATMPLRHFAA